MINLRCFFVNLKNYYKSLKKETKICILFILLLSLFINFKFIFLICIIFFNENKLKNNLFIILVLFFFCFLFIFDLFCNIKKKNYFNLYSIQRSGLSEYTIHYQSINYFTVFILSIFISIICLFLSNRKTHTNFKNLSLIFLLFNFFLYFFIFSQSIVIFFLSYEMLLILSSLLIITTSPNKRNNLTAIYFIF